MKGAFFVLVLMYNIRHLKETPITEIMLLTTSETQNVAQRAS